MLTPNILDKTKSLCDIHVSWIVYALDAKKPSVAKFRYCFTVVCFVYFVALRPKSTAMVMAGRSVHLPTLFPGQA